MDRGFGNAFEAFYQLFQWVVVALIIMLPLAIWKLVDICIWLWQHVSINVG